MEERRTRSVSPEDRDYPGRILAFAEEPQTLYYRGDLSLVDSPSIAIVGSRNCTLYGKTVATGLARRAAECGVTVISGLARGIDTAAAEGALSAKGKTIAVLGSGLDRYYPSENRGRQIAIAERGLLISEYPDGVGANGFHFPLRNRLISALADAVVVVEAATKSGSQITAERAVDQGKLLYAVPGNITSPNSVGTNKLIREGAIPMLFFDDVLRDIGADPELPEHRFGELGEDERLVLEILRREGETTAEELRRRSGLSPSTLSGLLSVLEIKGLIFFEMGKVMIAKL